jgi:dipeptidyl-peptidase-4
VSDTYPRQTARTRRFTLGAPRDLAVAVDGARVAFLRSGRGDDPVNKLWVLDLPAVGAAGSGTPRVVADPVELLADRHVSDAPDIADIPDIPDAERARRERARELAGGVVAFDADAQLTRATFALSGRVFLADLVTGAVEELPSSGDAFDPRLSPDGAFVAYVSGRSLRCTGADGDRLVVGEDDPDVSWGAAEFVAAEEMHRTRGFWWAPDSAHLLVARVDVSSVATWHIASPVDPWLAPTVVRYPAAGTTNATVSLHVLPASGGARVEVDWAQGEFEYLCDVMWAPRAEPTLVVQTRDQRTLAFARVDATTGAVHEIARQIDDDWVELVPGAPAWIGDRLVTAVDRDDTRRVCIDGGPITPVGLQVRRVLRADESGVLVAATEDPTEVHVWRFGLDGDDVALTDAPGVHSAVAGGDVVVLTSVGPDHDGLLCRVLRDGDEVAVIESFAEVPLARARPAFHVLGARALRAGLVLPGDGAAVDGPLPVLMDPYGGPHALRVQKARGAFSTSQWFADQGFAVVVVDGRGTPARGPAWERSVRGDLAHPVLEDQIDALHALAERDDRLDLSRVAIRGWSFGGYLAALAVIERPDVFHAAVAGAPVTEWVLYDTHYTERYLGHPAVEPESYARSDLTPRAAGLGAPLLLIHGMADDNVVVAHTLRLSRALLEQGRAHQLLALSGVTHMTPQETVAENLLRLEVDFLRSALARP